MKTLSLFTVFYIALSLIGCATKPSSSAGSNEIALIKKNPITINLYQEGQKPPLPYKVLGKETISKYNVVGIKRQEATIRDTLRTLAARMGGDAIINIERNEQSVSGIVIAFKENNLTTTG